MSRLTKNHEDAKANHTGPQSHAHLSAGTRSLTAAQTESGHPSADRRVAGEEKEAGMQVGTLTAALMGITKSGVREEGEKIRTLPRQGDAKISQLTCAARINYQNRVGNINQISEASMTPFISILRTH